MTTTFSFSVVIGHLPDLFRPSPGISRTEGDIVKGGNEGSVLGGHWVHLVPYVHRRVLHLRRGGPDTTPTSHKRKSH